MKEVYKSVSMDKSRIQIIEYSNSKYKLVKQTNLVEVANLNKMRNHLSSTPPLIQNDVSYSVIVPPIIAWSEEAQTIELEYMEGENLEKLLTSPSGKERIQYIEFVKNFIHWMESTGTFWRGAAPRNLLINSRDKTICMVDFERPITVKESTFTHPEFNALARGLVHEEFCAFLFESEQSEIFPDIWSNISSDPIPLVSIHGKRVKILLDNFFGPAEESVKPEQLMTVYKFMSSIVTPFLIKEKPFFPLQHIDNKINGPESYVRTILELSQLDRSAWPAYFGV